MQKPDERYVDGPRGTQKLPATKPELTPAQHAAVAAIVSGKTYTEVAEVVGVDRRTLFEWRQLPAFTAAVQFELQALRDAAGARLLALAGKAIDALEAVMAGDNEPAKVTAARDVLDRLRIHADSANAQTPASLGGMSEEPRTIWLVDADKAQELLSAQRQSERR